MTLEPFTAGWAVQRDGAAEWTPVDLPHDAMISEQRSASAPSWAHGAYFPGGRYRYRRIWTPGAEITDREVLLHFEGVYRNSRVLLDGRELGGSLSGYREFSVRLDPHLTPGTAHQIEVHVDNSAAPGSRWYTGSGIYRPVWLEVRDSLHLDRDGVDLHSSNAVASARASFTIPVVNPAARAVEVHLALWLDGRLIAESRKATQGVGVQITLEIPDPRWWSADEPTLYQAEITLTADRAQRDHLTLPVGLRTLELDPHRGLLINGAPVKLRGANIHHDHGVLGAVTLPGSERRRIRILKEAGFNAVRSAHNAASRALLDACDELGMYVMDEAFDGWYDHKTDGDDADRFDELWREELVAMVRKDRLRPSVLMYSIGNENGEALTPRGRGVASQLVAELRQLDPHRLVTIGVNMVAAAFAGLAGTHAKDPRETTLAAPDMTSTALNVISNKFGVLMKALPRVSGADRATAELFDMVDVAGYNYGISRYEKDVSLHPDRFIVGTESMPGDIAKSWALVEQHPQAIGDFIWAGWDYLGEAGGGSWSYGTRRAPFLKPYPQLVSGMGIIDIIGDPGAAIYLAQAAWGRLAVPAITVRPLDVPPGPVARTAWRATDAIASWSWRGHEGARAQIEIYSADDEVELLVNGRSLGRRAAGPSNGYLARYRHRYEPGVLEAIGYRRGVEVSRSTLRSAGAARLQLTCDFAEPGELGVVYLRIDLADADGLVESAAEDVVEVRVAGGGVLAGFGSAAPATEGSFVSSTTTTYRGRALAVIRVVRDEPIDITASSRTHGQQRLQLPQLHSLRATRATS